MLNVFGKSVFMDFLRLIKAILKVPNCQIVKIMTGNIRTLIDSILSEKEAKNGLHVRVISTHIFNESTNLFELAEDKLNYDSLKKKVNSILANEVKKKKGGKYLKVKNVQTGKDKKGFYRLKSQKQAKS